ncbi:RelA/SpoT family protein [Alkalibacillus haloalkaliphilus]|uniref:RelA/SpoT family protein n=1 Tax=Alkalibacillus haloalkaliphilus TaxID=94136 RepID=UPI002935D39E|nr:bifunctional (p)ppGpp synthetase/guanosine-3',5'-bis(diphosphate) 3'-pyrophosphohydrolase [Alkalibacillus haloalkaliphilus]MDV2581091.1 bifunctional (p)ppGpp synthetase/guanosine-3',5'-bis(diphosphate) 3'-pyrophosphohydrolase [Alkalibacillus haloalkaliphilus]
MAKHETKTIEQVTQDASRYLNEENTTFLRLAYDYAKEAHEGQIRKSGEEYIIHPVQVASILVDLEMDPATIASGFLHDVIEDTGITYDDLKEEFGEEVASLVEGVTKLGKIKYKSKQEQQAENHRKMFIAMAKDIRVILIKLADRLHNIRTLDHLPEHKQRRIANETLEIFAPLAHRLGISTIKWELEDISLRYLNPQQYYRIVNLMKQKRDERVYYIEKVINEIQDQLKDVSITAEISGRPKHIYSIYRKMAIQKKDFNEIYDLLAVRVIVKSIKDCYAVLGIIHTCWKPMPGRFKDYIAMPKPNLYQSLHTTVIGPKGDPLEVQIRTQEMHEIAEYGIAAHWAYKEGQDHDQENMSKQLAWFREILEWQSETNDAEEFMESLKVDFFSDMVYVFTPNGDVIELPSGSVPLDFAYRIHTEVGNKTVGAKVNGKIEPLDYRLKTGDIVEMLTSKHSYGPSEDWLKITQTSQAKNKIKQFFKKQRRDENVDHGKELIEKEIKSLDLSPKAVLVEENIQNALSRFHLNTLEDLYAAVGYQGITAQQATNRLTEKLIEKEKPVDLENSLIEAQQEVETKTKKKSTGIGVNVKGVDNLMVRLSKCCNPVPGDEIIGFITKGRGVSVHRDDCPNIKNEDEARLIDVEWEGVNRQRKNYSVDLKISGFDRNGLLNEILQVVNETNTDIVAVTGKSDKNKMAVIHLTILIQNVDHLRRIVDRIKHISDVFTVQRTIQ